MFYAIYTGATPEAGFSPVKKYTGGSVDFFAHKSTLNMVHKPYTAIIDLETMKVLAHDPKGRFMTPEDLVAACK